MHRSTLPDDPATRRLIDVYLRDLAEKVPAMTRLLDERHLEPLRKIAHQLKGTGGGFGFDPITSLAGTLEESIRQNASIEQVRQQVRELVEYIEQVEGYSPAAPGDANSD